jgi:REP element-mobilizing transposase RayT
MCSIANRSKGHIHEIGGTANHVHLLMELSNLDLFTDLIKTIKANSTSFIKSEFPEGANFSWQDGYGSFSVSYSQIESVKKYIRNQEVHHAKQSFEDEFLKMLKLHNSVVDPKYIFG